MSLTQAVNPLEVCTKEDTASTRVYEKSGSSAANATRLWHFGIFLASCFVIILRRPDMILHAQFYAEDGAIWYATAYNFGWWRVLFSPYEGYLHLLPRLTAGVALLAPMVYAPLIENLVAIAVQTLPVNLLLSPRLERWGTLRFRGVLALLYLALPNTQEMAGTISESQWFLALSALLLLTADPAKSLAGRAFDVLLFALCSLTGPFAICLFPIAVLLWFQDQKQQRLKVAMAILFSGATVQAAFLLTHHAGRHYPTLGANADSLARILSSQIYLGTLLGGNGLGPHLSLAVAASIAVLATAVWTACFVVSSKELRAVVIVAVLLLCASLARPIVFPPPGVTAWQQLSDVSGVRYWFFPCLAFAWSLAYGVRSSRKALGVACWCLLALLPIGLVRDFRYPAFADLHFADCVRQVEAARTGSTIVIPIRQAGWQAVLIKH